MALSSGQQRSLACLLAVPLSIQPIFFVIKRKTLRPVLRLLIRGLVWLKLPSKSSENKSQPIMDWPSKPLVYRVHNGEYPSKAPPSPHSSFLWPHYLNQIALFLPKTSSSSPILSPPLVQSSPTSPSPELVDPPLVATKLDRRRGPESYSQLSRSKSMMNVVLVLGK